MASETPKRSNMMTVIIVAIVVIAAAVAYMQFGDRGGSGNITSTDGSEGMGEAIGGADLETTASGLQYIEHSVGEGEMPQSGQTVVVHYTGWLYENGDKGAKFDSSVDRGQPFEFVIGQGQVIAGWDEGLATMRPGGSRTLILPPELGYGANGAGGVIPGGATLLFDVELLEIR